MRSIGRFVSSFALLLVSASSVHSQIVVNSLDDDGGPGDCELREAIINAENNNTSGSADCAAGSGDDVIDLTGLSGQIVLQSGDIIIASHMTISGPGADQLSISGNNADRIFYVIGGGELYLSDVTITEGNGSPFGGALYNRGKLELARCLLIDNHAGSGGAIMNEGNIPPAALANGTLNIIDSQFLNNSANLVGGAIWNDSLGSVTIERTTFAGNSATAGGAFLNDYRAVMVNTTFSANSASDEGGAIKARIGGPDRVLNLNHVTITNNSATAGGGGIFVQTLAGVDTADVGAFNSIIAGNEDPTSPDVGGYINDEGYNLIGDDSGSGGFTNGVGGSKVGTSGSPIDPGLYHLDDYGSYSHTHRLRPGSAAIDAGSCQGSVGFDQRGEPREVDLDDGTYPNADDACDMGAFELQESELEVGVDVTGAVLLEGAYASPGMTTALTASLPLTQPYGNAMYVGTPLEYGGTESVISIPADVVDWILVSLRTAPAANTEVARQPAFVMDDGSIVGLDGGTLHFADVPPVPYYIVVDHRNHAAVMTSEPLASFASGFGDWYFSTGEGAYSNGAPPMKDLFSEDGVYLMFAADGSADGNVTAPDFNLWNSATTAGLTGYQPADYNMDGNVTAPDFNLWNANTSAGAASQVPD